MLPYHKTVYATELTQEKIGERLADNIMTGFTFHNEKPYHGDFTPTRFSVRKINSKFKKHSVSPTVEGTFADFDGKTHVTLHLRPHTIWLFALGILCISFVFCLVLAVPELIKTGSPAILLTGLIPTLLIYLFFRVIFFIQSSTDIYFWEHILQLKEIGA